MTGRPRINIPLSSADRILENIGTGLLVTIWVLSVASYIQSPQVVPIHFNATGHADSFGSKIHILILPLIPTAIYFLLGWLNKRPHIFNYPVTITAENAARQYGNATKMLRVLKIVVLLVFIVIISTAYLAGSSSDNNLGVWTIPVLSILMLGPLGYFVYRSFKVK
jgi:uncharacterized membrane protein